MYAKCERAARVTQWQYQTIPMIPTLRPEVLAIPRFSVYGWSTSSGTQSDVTNTLQADSCDPVAALNDPEGRQDNGY